MECFVLCRDRQRGRVLLRLHRTAECQRHTGGVGRHIAEVSTDRAEQATNKEQQQRQQHQLCMNLPAMAGVGVGNKEQIGINGAFERG